MLDVKNAQALPWDNPEFRDWTLTSLLASILSANIFLQNSKTASISHGYIWVSHATLYHNF